MKKKKFFSAAAGTAVLAVAVWFGAAGLSGCSKTDNGAEGYREDVSAEDLRKAAADELGENYWPNAQIPAETLEEVYGVSEDLYDEAAAEMPMISAHVDTLIVLKAKEGQEDAVLEALEAYRARQVESAMQYPMNLGKIQAAEVERFGRYVCFAQLGGDITEPSEESDEAVIAHCREENARALAAIEDMLAL